ncbi:hypothetical protein KKA27_02795 [Patescibacteria group bacterium]|nr:hypothetical protein [Patescibacteria group bacterium]MBU2633594.1 hypothetical protein [Patescibacteria group bacterium]
MSKEFAVHCVSVYRNKKDSSKHMMKTTTLAGNGISGRMETIATVDFDSWADKWELISFSHAFLPFENYWQI